jgi:hypothetical protein
LSRGSHNLKINCAKSSTRIADIILATPKEATFLLSCISSMSTLTLSKKGQNPIRIKITIIGKI